MNFNQIKGKTVVVTGGAGFIGSHLCEALLALGARVVSVDDLSAGKRHNYRSFEDHPNFSFATIDITDKSALKRVFDQGVEVVFHNAASKKTVCLKDPARDLAVNAGGTLNLLQLSVDFGVKKFIQASTGSVYGEPVQMPTTESHPLNPNSYYGVSKLAGERYVAAFASLHDLDTTILRYFHVYGPRQESNEFGGVVPIFLRKSLMGDPLTIFGDGSQLRSFTWVGDLVQANLQAAVNPIARGKTYNCASGLKISISDLAEGILKLNPASKSRITYGPWTPGDIKFFDVDNRAIREELGLKFETDFWKRMGETYQGFVSYLETFDIMVRA